MTAITTSFGRRPVSLGQIATQIALGRTLAEAERPGSNLPAAVNKWTLFRTLTQIRMRLGVSDRALCVLNALLSFHPETALSLPVRQGAGASGGVGVGGGEGGLAARSDSAAGTDDQADDQAGAPGIDQAPEPRPCCDLIVFPSNKALAARAHGMTPMTLWRHLTALVEAGLITRRDSPNGKRYARKDDTGRERFSEAFGFDLTPLVVRAGEFEMIAEAEAAAEARRRLLRERVSLLRRDVTKLIGLGLDEGLAGDWEGLRQRAMALMTPLRRIRHDHDLEGLAASLGRLRDEATSLLELQVKTEDSICNPPHFDTHLSNSNPDPHLESEPASEEEGGRDYLLASAPEPGAARCEVKALPLGMVLEACPDVCDYGPAGRVRSWEDLVQAAAAVRPMIGISPDAWREAQAALGHVQAHVAVAAILQRSIHSSEAVQPAGALKIEVNGSPAIQSAGGYLRALTDKARAGEFTLGPLLMALIGQRLKARAGRRMAAQP